MEISILNHFLSVKRMSSNQYSTDVETVISIIQKMKNRIDELELEISNIYKFSNRVHIHTSPSKKLLRRIDNFIKEKEEIEFMEKIFKRSE